MHIDFGRVLARVRGSLGQAKAAAGIVPEAQAVVAAARAGDPVTALETAEQAAAAVGALIGQPEVAAGATLALQVTEQAAPALQKVLPDLGVLLSAVWHHGHETGHAEAAAQAATAPAP